MTSYCEFQESSLKFLKFGLDFGVSDDLQRGPSRIHNESTRLKVIFNYLSFLSLSEICLIVRQCVVLHKLIVALFASHIKVFLDNRDICFE